MSNVRTAAAVLALALAVAATVQPASAKQQTHRGHDARAQAIDPGEAAMTPEREKALRECSEHANRLMQKDWGVMQGEQMASCMNAHGQPE